MAKRCARLSTTTNPTLPLRPLIGLRAMRFGVYDSSRAALRTRSRVWVDTRPCPFTAFDAVVRETPALVATSLSVTDRPDLVA